MQALTLIKSSSAKPATGLPVMLRGSKTTSPAHASAFAGTVIVFPSGSVCDDPCPDDVDAASKSSDVCAARENKKQRLKCHSVHIPRRRLRIAP